VDDKIDKILDKVTIIREEQIKQGVHIEQNTKDLTIHVKRTDLLEEALNKHAEENEKQLEQLFMPRKTLLNMSKFIGIIGALAGSIYAVYRLISLL